MSHSLLQITIRDKSTMIDYIVDNHTIVSHTHEIGYYHLEQYGMNSIARSKLTDGILYTLEFISLSDRIPTDFRVVSPRYATWIGNAIESTSYSQFYTRGVPVSVTLENTDSVPLFYARHSKTIQSFKV